MRLFIAIDFDSINGYLKEIQSQLLEISNLSLVTSFHLTLKFLGEVEEENYSLIKSKLKEIKFEKFNIFLDKVGVFETRGEPGVVFVSIKQQINLLELQKSIESALSGFSSDFDFTAHVTLARARKLDDKKQFIGKIIKIQFKNLSVTVDKFELMKSELTRKGPAYTVIEPFKCSNL
ncbi:MAG TPA: RNA 2',3'-cyclic phosphodiesterase [Candidatus Nanoarchaeia archaeon]|nr:RNA 2',3'-cyclic phosphodiesterase [Candidatus Nanoarchaeia archaeon]